MKMPTVIFSHGQESGPWGTKIRQMAAAAKEDGCEVDSIDYRGIADPGERVEKLVASCAAFETPLVLVGSSMGGHVATAAAATLRPAGVFVLAPAYYMPGYESLTPQPPSCPLMIVHGWRDDVVPVENSIRYAKECRATLHVLDGDHRLTENIDEIVALLRRFISTI
jgi:pimeloyl-ACP methyl ester carboxylesterase